MNYIFSRKHAVCTGYKAIFRKSTVANGTSLSHESSNSSPLLRRGKAFFQNSLVYMGHGNLYKSVFEELFYFSSGSSCP